MLMSAQCFCQTTDSFICSTGYKYRVGDQVKMGLGNMSDGVFKYAYVDPASFRGVMLAPKVLYMWSQYANKNFTIKKIKEGKGKTYLVLKEDGPWLVDVEAALQVGELLTGAAPKQTVVPTMQAPSQADELAKFKKLMDDGVITKDEFEAKKKQILGL